MSAGTTQSRFENAPRYTSYPTTPHFGRAIDDQVVRQWLSDIPANETVSLYLHIPFCDRLCWFCACHTQHTVRYQPVARYLDLLRGEIGLVSALTAHVRIGKIHFGGGSPTILTSSDIQDLSRLLHSSFDIEDHATLSVEIDPTDMTEEKLDGLLAAGLGRASIGIQDFDPRVQEAINRPQGFDATSRVIEHLRKGGVQSVNVDLLYGLPYQTERSLAATISQVLTMKPDRIALFGYAHVPWFKKHQRLIDERALPSLTARFHQARMAGQMLVAAGYRQIVNRRAKLTPDRRPILTPS
jgi:oxygen-independent coproporphyrinogen III oxidase